MDLVTINYSNWKAGRALALPITGFIFPFAMYSVAPGMFGLANNSLFQLLLTYSFFGFWILVSGSVTLSIVRKLLSKEAAIELSETGIRSNASGFTVKSIPLCDIDKAVISWNHRGGKFVHVRIKKDALAKHAKLTVNARWFDAEPTIRIFYQLLEGSAENIADTINQYIEDSNAAESSNDIVSGTLADYVNRAA